MKIKTHLILIFSFFLLSKINVAQTNKTVGTNIPLNPGEIQSRGCATQIPSQKWEDQFQILVAQYLQQHPEEAKMIGNSSTMAGYSIPVIIHVIHGGQAVGSFPNLAQGQLTSQVTVLDNDFSGIGQNVGNYPATAFTTFATNTLISAASKDANGRIGIINCNINFCLATKDTLGNILAEPGIHRVNYNTLPATAFPSKNPAATNYNTPALFTNFMNNYIKPNTIWNVSKYLNIWVSDRQNATGLLGYATFPPLSTLSGIPGGVGTATSDGFWSWAASFGSSTIFPGGSYAAPYDKGRTCTHEIGHWLGLRHIWGDGSCATDYCIDTPPASGSNGGSPAYPFKANTCNASSPPNGANGEMFMNFMDYTNDLAMYMFTNDQRTRAHVAMQNSPYRKFLGTHGLCNLPAPIANFSVAPNPVCNGATLNIGDLSLNVPTSWSYTMSGGTPSISTAQNPTVSFASPGIYSITLIATNLAGSSTPITKTVSVVAGPTFTLSSNPSATLCAGNSATISMIGGTSYTLLNTGSTSAPFIVTPTVATIYSVSAVSAGTNTCYRTQTLSIAIGTIAINITPTVASVCSGQSVALTGSGATTYTWSTGSNATSIIVTPTAVTVYTLNGTSGGCNGTKTVQVNINASPTISVNNATICPAGTASLIASGANTYTWNTGPTTSVITVSPPVNTNYTVSGTNALGCVSSKTVSVTISGALSLSITANPTVVCSGQPSTLTASGATTYTWNTGPTGANLVVSPSATTNYTVTGTAGTCSGTQTINLVVNSNPTITPTSSSASICVGGSATLSTTGATSYTWNPGNFVGASYAVSPAATTIYTVTGTNASGCSDTKTISLAVNSLPTINVSANPATICSGQTSTLTASGATTYSWSAGGTGSTKTVTPLSTTVYMVTGTVGICSNSNTVSVNVNPTPTVSVNNATICPAGTATLIASGANTYSWSTSATTSVITVSPPINTTYTVTGTSLGCSNTKTVSVSIGTAISINVNASPANVCIGGSSTLTASGASTYTWSTGPSGSSIVVSPTTNSTYTVVGTSGSCTGSNTISLVVNQLATTALAGPNQTLCISNPSTTLAGNTAAVGTGSWSVISGAATIANPTLPNTTISAVAIGLNILQWQITNGACSSVSTMTVTVDALPTTANSIASQTVCSTSATLTGNAPAVGTGAWSLVAGAGAITSPNSLTTGLTGLGAGTNIFQWTISNGAVCPPSSSTVSVANSNTLTVTAVTASSIICVGSTVNITASGATTYSWSTGATTSVIAVSPSVTTTYTVDGSNGSCSSSAIIAQSVSACTGLSQLPNTNYNVLVYPNPFKEEVTVNAGELVTAQVFNTLGQLIIVKTINGIGAINTAELAKGVYYLNVKGISGSKTLKVVKE
ncbi:MAG: T9SS type A sorting domain-containing protein [Bacteroidota bacterium]|nr:T9SS type A sorting domain-containing protein [Bacteroidota bacterium]MDP3147067.1 T9SS type A sorting domain-containing protein [Bacteroidota bacterium]